MLTKIKKILDPILKDKEAFDLLMLNKFDQEKKQVKLNAFEAPNWNKEITELLKKVVEFCEMTLEAVIKDDKELQKKIESKALLFKNQVERINFLWDECTYTEEQFKIFSFVMNIISGLEYLIENWYIDWKKVKGNYYLSVH